MAIAMIKMMVLKELNTQEQSGYDLIKKINMSGNKPSPGYIYPLLRDLETRGFVSCMEEKRRKVYSITKEGRKFLNNLTRMHEHTMNLMIKNFEPISTRDEMKEIYKFQATMKQNNNLMVSDKYVMAKFKNAVFSIYAKDYEKKRSKLLSVIKKATQQVERLAKE
ncbi:MAG TPA: PadR family transcriptional regulator [Candidatus Nitrosotalea sp.]|nr:PadR family transcriptional regulator [Candidatus Nitrosotalea sp.]